MSGDKPMSGIAAPYVNAGNALVLSMVPKDTCRVLDVGCGGGDNARLLREMRPGIEVIGLTRSSEEATIAAPHMNKTHVVDLEKDLTDDVITQWGGQFDLLLFSHVLEHLTDPVSVIRRCLTRVRSSGHVLIAVPNVVEWRTRIQLLRGNFVYTDQGILDRTHMRFFTYRTAADELVSPIAGLHLLEQRGRGSVPLGPLRKIRLAHSLWRAIDSAGVNWRPNFCCSETALLARWDGPVS